MTLFRLDASIRTEGSASCELADLVEREWAANHPGASVVRRHLGADPLPATAWPAAVQGSVTPEGERSAEQTEALALATTLADELLAAEVVLLAVPLYNFGVSQHFKAYVDLVNIDPRTLTGEQPLLAGKPVVLTTVRGGAYGADTPRAGWDHSTPYLRRIIADLWGAELTVVEREFTLVGVNPALDAFTDIAAEMHTRALDEARTAGRALGALPVAV